LLGDEPASQLLGFGKGLLFERRVAQKLVHQHAPRQSEREFIEMCRQVAWHRGTGSATDGDPT
jgi:hypothetical protein